MYARIGFDPSGRLVAIGTMSSYSNDYAYQTGSRDGAPPQSVPEPATLAALSPREEGTPRLVAQ